MATESGRKLTEEDGRAALLDHIRGRALRAAMRYHSFDQVTEIEQLLLDREVVRYPVELEFDAAQLQSGELAFVVPKGDHPKQGFRLVVSPHLRQQPRFLAAVVLYQLVRVNYGDIATSEDAETFGSMMLKMDQDGYYDLLCHLSDGAVTSCPLSLPQLS